MSQIHSKSPKHCGEKHTTTPLHIPKKHYKKIFCVTSTFFTLILTLILLIYLLLHPSKPQFSLKEADIYLLDFSSTSHLLNSSIQLTFLSHNPNHKVTIYYDDIHLYASYKGQQITLHSSIDPFFQGVDETNLLSASLVGRALPVSASFGYEVARDRMAGRLVLSFKMNGKLRWKVGTWVSAKYRFDVNCVSVVALNTDPLLSSKQGTHCSTTI